MLEVREEDIDRITELFHRVLKGEVPGPIALPADYPRNEMRQVVEYANRFVAEYQALAGAMSAMSIGQLDLNVPVGKMHVLQSFKHLHASLRHLTWKTQQIAGGDLTQRVDFMGEFAEAFNAMTAQLGSLIEKVCQLATRDSLTGLHNRRHFLAAAGNEVQRARRHELPLSVLMLDLDHFKQINDRHGHLAGDQVLRQAAEILRREIRTIDLSARYGGEEFVLLPAQTPADGALVLADRIRSAIQREVFRAAESVIPVTASIGVAGLSQVGPEPDDAILLSLIDRADQALYHAKAAGRNRVTLYPGVSPAAA